MTVLLSVILTSVWIITDGSPACTSKIWCTGPLLKDVQMADIYPDSKTFVDMNLKADPDFVLSAYSNISKGATPSKAALKSFIAQYFDGPGTEFEKWTPSDYAESPSFLKRIKNEDLRHFGSELCKIWSHLGRKIRSDVKDHQNRYSLIYLDNPFIVPGGRFREIYYWDSYWVVQGLLTCEMKTTVKGMLENLISFIKKYGLVPNGGRVYYTGRSQPPLLIPMVDMYVKSTGDTQFLRDNIDYLVKEYNFWMKYRRFTVKKYSLNRYAAPQSTPRPESYREDFKLGETVAFKGGSKETFYSNIASAAESGWDFSTRWFKQGYQTHNKTRWLQDINTRDILPVDLNSIMCWNEKLLSKFYKSLDDQVESSKWLKKHEDRMRAVEDIFWDQEKGSWFDYRLSSSQKNTEFFPSSVFPLFTGCFSENKAESYTKKTINYLKYVVTDKGSRGGGGEYDVQEGFGWTNGVILDLLDKFGRDLTMDIASGGTYIGSMAMIPILLISWTCQSIFHFIL